MKKFKIIEPKEETKNTTRDYLKIKTNVLEPAYNGFNGRSFIFLQRSNKFLLGSLGFVLILR